MYFVFCIFSLPQPAILKPEPLWTGKQIFGLLLKPNRQCKVEANLEAKGKSYTKDRELCINDSYVVIRNSELLAGSMDKSTMGSGTKANIFYVLLRDFGEDAACLAMWRLGRVASWFLMNRGFSIGIGDVTPTASLEKQKRGLVESGYERCSLYIRQLAEGTLPCQVNSLRLLSLRFLSSTVCRPVAPRRRPSRRTSCTSSPRSVTRPASPPSPPSTSQTRPSPWRCAVPRAPSSTSPR